MNKTIDNETILLKVESFEHRIEILENTLSAAKEVLTLEEAALFMSRSLLSKEDSSHNSLTAIKDRLSTAIRSLTATTTRTATNSRLRTQECDLHRQTIPKDVYRYRTIRQTETTF